MIEQDNIKEYAIAAFRHYGHRESLRATDGRVIAAVTSTIRHLIADGDNESVRVIERVYCALPLGRVKKNDVSSRVLSAAADMSMDARTIWRKLARARKLFYTYNKIIQQDITVTQSCHAQE